MNPITKALLACAAVCIALYFLIDEFLGSTDGLKDSLDVKSLAYTRQPESQAKPKAEPELVAQGPERVEEEAPVRDQTVERIDAASVLPKSDDKKDEPGKADEEQEGKELVEDEEADEATEVASSDVEEDSASSAEALLKETLGIDEPEPPVRAVDVSYQLPENCEASGVALAPVAVQYRFESPTITGASLTELEFLMTEYRHCDGGEFRFSHNPLGKEDATALLKQMRLDELKYFFLQHRVPKTALRFPDDS